VLESTIWAPVSRSWEAVTPFTVARVPTGMNRGVVTTPWGVWKQPQRARVLRHWAVMSKEKAGGKLIAPNRCCYDARCRLQEPVLKSFSGWIPGWLRDLAGAWVFYSVLPAWPGVMPRFERIARFGPLIGLVLGGVQGLFWWLSAGWMPLGAQVALVLALGLVLTGGLHIDGAMDTADGLGAGPRALEAMADSRVGASGVQALVVLLLLRAGALLCLAAAAPLALLWAAFWGRVAPLLAMQWYPYLREQGSAGFHRQHWRGLSAELAPALLVLALALGLAAWTHWPWPQGLGLLPAVLVPVWFGRRLGGHSGDSYGACVEWTESLALLLMALLLGLGSRLAA
jgi:adenosylcobinamide-GDP ribazoletransferase